ncbi:MAG: LD-carboxypeptidase [Legionellaceae bacterium]|nr:LD-carboxypeptidase [Legionellaceae bacterium]
MQTLIKPNKLSFGDTIATITLSWGGAGLLPDRYEIGKSRLQDVFGLNVVETKHALRDPEWIYQNPQARASDLMDAFANPEIKGIFSMIGGDDSIRMLPYIDYDVIRNNPKIFLGFSDSTVTHFICRKAGLGTFYGPAVLTAFAENVNMHRYTIDSINKILFSSDVVGVLPENKDGWTSELLDWGVKTNQTILRKLNSPEPWRFIQGSGKVQGHLIGGCVEVLQFIMGTEIWPNLSDWDNAILFLETSEEGMPSGQLERFLRGLGAQHIIKRLAGIIFSKPGGHLMKSSDFKEFDHGILKILKEFDRIDLPVVTNMDFGHTDPMMTLPYGRIMQINVDEKQIAIMENSVS